MGMMMMMMMMMMKTTSIFLASTFPGRVRWMENHPLPFVCTTNLMERLDPACLRRFALKLRFDPLTPAQAAVAFQRFFGIEAPDALMAGLTPGDFATVRKKHAILGGGARTLAEG
jgi:hypothetical protein